jgi:CHAT domain
VAYVTNITPDSDNLFSLGPEVEMAMVVVEKHEDELSLDERIALHRKAIESHSSADDSDIFRLQLHIDLGNDLRVRFYDTGDFSDLEEAILLLRKDVQVSPFHPSNLVSLRMARLRSLAMALHARFRQIIQHADLDEAVALLRKVSALMPVTDPHFPAVRYDLATALLDRYHHQKHLPALEEAINCHRENLRVQSNLTDQQAFDFQSALADAVLRRYERERLSPDLEEGVSLLWKAIEIPNIPKRCRAMPLHDLANAPNTLFLETGELVCLEQAIEFAQEGCEAIPKDHPVACTMWFTLGELLEDKYCWTRFNLQVNDPNRITVEHSDMIVRTAHAYSTAAYHCISSPATQRFIATRALAKLAFSSRDVPPVYSSALEAYRTAIELLPSLIPMHLDLESRQRALAPSGGLALEAVTCAIRFQKYDMAVQFLEAGRSIFWSQALQLRIPLQTVKPEFAQRLREISIALEEGARRDVSRSIHDPDEKVALIENEAALDRRYSAERSKIIEDVRSLDGFQDFLREKPFSTLQKACAHGPVVILIDSERQSECSALVLKDGNEPAHVVLPLTILLLRVLVNKVRRFPVFPLARGEVARHGAMARPKGPDVDTILREVLETLWTYIVKPILRFLGLQVRLYCACLHIVYDSTYIELQKSESPPRLWWLATGVFACLPIHAAGIYDGPEIESISDFVISSYTPTLSALLAPKPDTSVSCKMMVVIDKANLLHASAELKKIEERVPNERLVKLGVPGAPAHTKDVLSGLESTSIAHFACHGIQNTENPLESALHLQIDRPLKVSSLMQLSLQNSALAFLGACQTAMGGGELSDECRHLAATFLFVGFRGVVGTMWYVGQLLCSEIYICQGD